MGLQETFQKAAISAFKATGNVIVEAAYQYDSDDGFGTANSENQTLKLLLEENMSNKYIQQHYSNVFGENIIESNIICSTPFLWCDYEVRNGAKITLNAIEYEVKGVSADPANAVISMLLRVV